MHEIASTAQLGYEIAKGMWKPHLYLTNMATAYFAAAADYAAKQVFPIVPVQLSSSFYYKFSKEDLARDDMQRKPQFGKVMPALLGQAEDTYSCKVDQIIIGIDQLQALNYQRTNAPGVADPRTAKVRAATEKVNIPLDAVFAKNFFKSSVWNEVRTGVTATPGTTQFWQWDNANSDPITYIDSLMTYVKKNGRRKPNVLALGADAYNGLKHNAVILERVKYSGSTPNPATVNTNVLAQLFGLDKVVVIESTYNAAKPGLAADMEYICDSKAALLCYAAPAPAIDEPSAGYIFAWDMLGDGQVMPMAQWDGENGTHSEFIEGLMAYDMKQTGQDLAIFLSACVA
jgi:hypothetical protein